MVELAGDRAQCGEKVGPGADHGQGPVRAGGPGPKQHPGYGLRSDLGMVCGVRQ